MKIKYLIITILLLVFTLSCTTAGPRNVNINFLGKNKSVIDGGIAVAPFSDKRENLKKGYIGKRVLSFGDEELFFVNGSNLSQTITNAFVSYIKKSGSKVIKTNKFEPDLESLKEADKNTKYIMTGEIKNFEFSANKGFLTAMSLDIKILVYLGNTQSLTLTKIPVILNLKRKDINFSIELIENFISRSLEEVIVRAMATENFQ